MMRNGRSRERGNLDDLPDVQALARLESEEDALAVFVAECGEDPRHVLPGGRDCLGVIFIHNHILGYMIMFVKAPFWVKNEATRRDKLNKEK